VKVRGLRSPFRYFGLARSVPFARGTNTRTCDVRQGEDECSGSRFLFSLA
jgi:hypothetical protein